MLARNVHAGIVGHLAASTLADIEGLDPNKVGFVRRGGGLFSGGGGECCDPDTGDKSSAALGKLVRTFDPVPFHAFVASGISYTQWNSHATNVERLDELSRALPRQAKTTAIHTDGAVIPAGSLLTMRYDDRSRDIDVRCWLPGWSADAIALFAATGKAQGHESALPSTDRHVFVCSHRTRDGRCGYCGPVLMDLLKKALAVEEQSVVSSGARPPRVHVWPCSHIGGHVFAGNVVVYSTTSGTCLGCVAPTDVPRLAKWLSGAAPVNDDDLPTEFLRLKRGSMRLPAVRS